MATTSDGQASATTTHVVSLDLLPLICALTVTGYHYLPLTALSGGKPWHALWFGWLGVPLFFVLSGQLIARSATRKQSGAFLRKRWPRLAPAAWLCASLSALALAATGTPPIGTIAGRWLAALAMVPLSLPVLAWSIAARAEPAIRRAMEYIMASVADALRRCRDLAPGSVRNASPPAG